MRFLFPIIVVAVMTACSAPSNQVLVDPQSSVLRVSTRAGSVLVKDVSLPAYAKAAEITVRGADGTLTQVKGQIWADDPPRAMTGAMVRNLGVITGAQVAAESWPLDGLPAAEVTLRVEHMFATSDGTVKLAGYYAIRRDTGRSLIRQFDIDLPAASNDAQGIAPTYEAAWTQLAEKIARDL